MPRRSQRQATRKSARRQLHKFLWGGGSKNCESFSAPLPGPTLHRACPPVGRIYGRLTQRQPEPLLGSLAEVVERSNEKLVAAIRYMPAHARRDLVLPLRRACDIRVWRNQAGLTGQRPRTHVDEPAAWR